MFGFVNSRFLPSGSAFSNIWEQLAPYTPSDYRLTNLTIKFSPLFTVHIGARIELWRFFGQKRHLGQGFPQTNPSDGKFSL